MSGNVGKAVLIGHLRMLELPINDPKRSEEVASFVFRWILNSAAIVVREVDKFYEENRPDLVIYEEAAYAGRILAKLRHCPAIQYYPDFIQHNRMVYGGPNADYNPPSIVNFSRLLDSFLWAYGFEETNNFDHSEDLNLYQFPREFQFNADSIDSRRFCFVGPFLDRPFTPMWKNHSGGRRVILVSAIPGTDANYFSRFIEALSGSEYHVILSVGEHMPTSAELQTLPANFEINTSASHLEILPHTDLHVYSGGPTGTLEGLYFGVPLIAIPFEDHNKIIVDRLSELGVVLNLPSQSLTSRMIREKIEAALRDSAFLSRVKEMQGVIRSSGGSVMAADRIDDYLAGRGS